MGGTGGRDRWEGQVGGTSEGIVGGTGGRDRWEGLVKG